MRDIGFYRTLDPTVQARARKMAWLYIPTITYNPISGYIIDHPYIPIEV
jgi:hypothetical protein